MAVSLLIDTPERQQQLDFVDYMKSYLVMMAKPARVGKVDSVDGMCGFTVAVQSGALQDDLVRKQSDICLRKGLKPINLIVVPNTSDAQLQVMNGRADFFITAYASGKDYERITDVRIVGPRLSPQYHGAGVKKGDAQLVDLMNSALAAIMKDGTYDSILVKYDLKALRLDTPVINGAVTQPLAEGRD